MTIKRTRELLGNRIKYLSDDEVAVMIARDAQMVRELIPVFDKFLTTGRWKFNNGITDD